MDPVSALIAFSIAAALLTVTPGLDTALALRTAAIEGGRQAMLAGLGVAAGVLAWGMVAALGLGALLALSKTGYTILQYAGAGYLLWLGLQMWRRALRPGAGLFAGHGWLLPSGKADRAPSGRWFLRGLLTNLLNPKVGVFYVSFLPQFLPSGVNIVAFSVLLAGIHAAMGLVWYAALALATRPLSRVLRREAVGRSLEGITGTVMIAFGIRLALDRHTI